MPSFPSPYFDMRCCLFLDRTLWLREGRSGRSTERLLLQHSQRYCPGHFSSPDADYDCQKNNKLVWDETIRIMVDLFDNVWGDRSEIAVDHCVDVTLPVRSYDSDLRISPCANISTRLLSSSSASQVYLYPISGCHNFMTANTRVRPSGDMDN